MSLARIGVPKVYLAGPITGITYEGATDWRQRFWMELSSLAGNIKCVSPLRGKSHLRGTGPISVMGNPDHAMSTNRAIIARDHWDCITADAVVANLLGATAPSLGTTMEIGWAYTHRKPLILVMEEGNPHEHPMIIEAADFRARDLSEAARIVQVLLEGQL